MPVLHARQRNMGMTAKNTAGQRRSPASHGDFQRTHGCEYRVCLSAWRATEKRAKRMHAHQQAHSSGSDDRGKQVGHSAFNIECFSRGHRKKSSLARRVEQGVFGVGNRRRDIGQLLAISPILTMQRRKQFVHDLFVENPDRSTRNAVRQLAGGRAVVAGRIEDAAAKLARATLVWKMNNCRTASHAFNGGDSDRRGSGFVRPSSTTSISTATFFFVPRPYGPCTLRPRCPSPAFWFLYDTALARAL